MRTLLGAVLLFTLAVSASADVTISGCATIRKESHDQIVCSFIDQTYLLEYRNKAAYRITRWSGKHDDMLRFLCKDGLVITETLNGRMKSIHRCP